MKIRATIRKELLLLIRDPGGLALIFLMPMALVMVMALVQDAPFRDYQESSIEVLFADEDGDSLGQKIQDAFSESPNIHLVIQNDTSVIKSLVSSGKYKAAILIPSGASEALRRKDQQMIASLISNMGLANQPVDSTSLPAIDIQLLFDPAIKANYKQALSGVIEEVIAHVHTNLILDQLQQQLSVPGSANKMITPDFEKAIQIEQHYASGKTNDILLLNSVQHNVPAWTMFAMFFILFPLAGNFIKEREEGSMLRLRLIAGSHFPVIAGKFAFYFCVCLLQFVMMILIGIYIMPLLGLQALVLGSNMIGTVLTACMVAMAATGYGLLIAVYFKTPQQALSFGSVSVVILAALGGVWVPVYAMPQFFQNISRFSPLNWGLESFNNLFLRNAPTLLILPDLIKLLCFAGVTLAMSIFIHKSRTIT